MKKNLIIFIFICFLLFKITPVDAQKPPQPHHITPVIITDEKTEYPLGLHLEILEDQTQKLTLENITQSEINQKFVPNQKPIPNFGTTKSAIWLRFRVKNQAKLTKNWRLILGTPRMGNLEYYYLEGKKIIIKKTGRNFPFNTREFNHRYFIFNLPVNPSEQTIYLRFTHEGNMTIPLSIWSLDDFLQTDQINILCLGISYGIIIIMIGYNFFLYLSLRDKSYLLYAILISSYLLYQLCREGLGHQYLWTNFPNNIQLQFAFVIIFLISILQFTSSILEIKTTQPKLNKLINGFSLLILFIAIPLILIIFGQNIMNILALLVCIIIIITALIRWQQGYYPARYFLLAVLAPNIGTILLICNAFGWIKNNNYPIEVIFHLGFILLVLLFAIALADRINLIKQQKNQAQAEALKNAQLNEKLIREQNMILEQKVNERTTELAIAKEKAEVANQAKSAFIANMSHELRTPLNAILGFSQIMMRSQILPAEHRENTLIINRSGEHLLTLINNILDLSKIEAGKMTLNPHNFDFHNLLTEVEDLLQITAANKGIQLIFDQAAELPQYIYTDEIKLRQVLINLINNGIKFTFEGGVSVVVSSDNLLHNHHQSGEQKPQAKIIFEIRDTGIGIAANELDQLFEAFTQTATGKQVQEGTGLGLAISKKFVELMGGDITVKSEIGIGTVFRFEIIADIASGSDVKNPQINQRQVIGLQPNQPDYKILIVDDRPTNRLLLIKLLQPLGFQLKEASNGQEAIEIWEKWQPHLIWMDMRMPVKDGYEATQYIKSTIKGNATAIIALTASVLEEEKAIVLSAGCDDFIRKPFRDSIIFDTMAKHLGVQYIYEEYNQAQTPAQNPNLTAEDFNNMPSEWLENLYQATMDLDDELMLELIKQIPANNSLLAQKLIYLVDHFQVHKIRELIRVSV